MAPDIEKVLKKAYQESHGKEKQEAEKWLEHLQAAGRYVKDVWIDKQLVD